MIGIDIGTTNWKVGVINEDHECIKLVSTSSILHSDESGNPYYDPDELWNSVKKMLREISQYTAVGVRSSIGITSMAESGLWVNKTTGECISHIIPWFDTRTQKLFEEKKDSLGGFGYFQKTGLHGSYKYGIFKNLYLISQYSGNLSDVVWLSVSDFIAYKLTGEIATDYTLAARTYAFNIMEKVWNYSELQELGIPVNIFPKAYPSGTVLGEVLGNVSKEIGIDKGTEVSISGHDHLCSAIAINCTREKDVYASVGTAAVILGNFEKRELEYRDYTTGLSYGPHVIDNRMTWLGSIQSAGGSIEWARRVFGDDLISYERLLHLLSVVKKSPTGILFYPHLSGSGAPHLDADARGSFIGLDNHHSREEMLLSILEGISYEAKMIFDVVGKNYEDSHSCMKVVGGGAKNQYLVQTLADVLGKSIDIQKIDEATLLGAALMPTFIHEVKKSESKSSTVLSLVPDKSKHLQYNKIYYDSYKPLHAILRKTTKTLKMEEK